MRNLYIIPTLGRPTIGRAIESILKYDTNAKIFISAGGSAGENRDDGLLLADPFDWIIFLDDDDYFSGNFLPELDSSFDIVVLRMLQYGNEIPDRTNELRWQNVGINFAINVGFYWQHRETFGNNKEYGEDWRFFSKLLEHNPRVKITDKVYYIAEHKGNYQK